MNVNNSNLAEANMDIIPIENAEQNTSVFSVFLKRTTDIFASIFGIVLLLPITIIVFFAKKISRDKTKLFFVQERIGKNGKLFKMYKFNTMIDNADEELKKYLTKNKEARVEYKIKKKLANDPRVTKIGKILRKNSIDEIPQFINVLKGEMSLVGPRPYLPREKKEMGEYYTHIIQCKPGITGPWQVPLFSDKGILQSAKGGGMNGSNRFSSYRH